MELDKVYKLDVSGNVRVWWAEVGEGALEGHWRSHSGLIDGAITSSEWKSVEAKSQATSKAQALFYAKAAMTKRLGLDYRTSITNIHEKRESLIRPMLAYEYYDWVGSCFAQPKLDGMRVLANESGLWTRANKKVISCPHIEKELKTFFQEYPNIILDGELYNHDLHDNFNSIMSIARKTILTPVDLMKSEKYLEYWIFDIFDQEHPKMIYSERYRFLFDKLFNLDHNINMIKPIPSKWIIKQEELDIYNIELLEQGYEGQIVRLNTPYEQKRTHNLLKRKEFQDKEFELVEIQEGAGNWEGYAKIAICRLENGETFGAGISGSQEFCLQLLKDKDKYLAVTVKYQTLTPDGIPRFPIAIKFHEEMFEEFDRIIKPKKNLFT